MRRLQRGILRRASEGEPVKLDDAVIAAAKGRRSYVTSRVRTSWPAKGDVAAEVETPAPGFLQGDTCSAGEVVATGACGAETSDPQDTRGPLRGFTPQSW